MAAFREIKCSEACHKIKKKFPYPWDLNIYRGCEHGCKYCFAMYSHQYLSNDNYFDEIFVKTNVVEKLEEQLRKPSWKKEIINLGGVTDSYQPAEQHYRLMPDILRLMIRYQNPCIISTKSDLILRDYDLIDELSRLTYVNVAATITCMDESVRRKIEPNGAESLKRFAMLKAFSKTNASTGLHFMPIIPYLTDTRENIEALFACAKDSRVGYFIPGALNLRGRTRVVFFDFIHNEFPKLEMPLKSLYKTGSLDKTYRFGLYARVNELKAKYHLSDNYTRPIKEKLKQTEEEQLSFF